MRTDLDIGGVLCSAWKPLSESYSDAAISRFSHAHAANGSRASRTSTWGRGLRLAQTMRGNLARSCSPHYMYRIAIALSEHCSVHNYLESSAGPQLTENQFPPVDHLSIGKSTAYTTACTATCHTVVNCLM